jgi:DNA polymerase-3 subunit alpha
MYLKSPAEMARASRRSRAAIEGDARDRRALQVKLKLGEPMLPSFKVPEGYDTEGYFRHVAREGLETRFEEFEAQGKKRRPRRRTARGSRWSSTSSRR